MKKRIIVDIDNTLWDLAPELWKELQIFNPQMPPPAKWRDWDFWEEHVQTRDLYRALREVHMKQDHYFPYTDSREFLTGLKRRNFFITIASHREKGTLDPTVRWLRKHDLPYDEVHLSNDKTVLFDQSWAIVDDSPVTLGKAAGAGIIRAGLRNPWNERTDHPLFDNLLEILIFIDSKMATTS
jgi:5'(3')-deoxyribonucleotidase